MTASRRACVLAVAALALAGACRKTTRIRRTGDAAAVVMVPPDPSREGEGPAAAEREPNDDPARPEALALAGAPLAVAVTGTLPVAGKKRDVDLFKIDVPVAAEAVAPAPADGRAAGARRLAVELRAEGLPVTAQVLDPQGQVLASLAPAAGERDGFPNVSAMPGASYLVRVRGAAAGRGADAGGVAGYRLAARVEDFEIGDEREPNGAAASANALDRAESGAEAAGFLAGRRDEDWYRVSFEGLGAPAAVSAEVDALEGVAITVAVHDAAGVRLGSARGRREQRAAIEGVPIPAAAGAPAQSCYVVVRAESGHNFEQRYHLRVRAEVRDETAPAAGAAP